MEQATLDALIYGKEQCVSFRHASALFSLPTRSAQELLLAYIHSQPAEKLSALWIVSCRDQNTNALKSMLTTSPAPTDKKQIWAVGPASASAAPSLHAAWIAHDTKREKDLVKRPSHEPNELRDGRFNVLKSRTSVYDERIDPRLVTNSNMLNRNGAEKRNNSSSFLSMVKSKTKGKKNKQAPISFKKSTNGSTSSLFSSKPLGADSIRKIKAEKHVDTEEFSGEKKVTSSTATPSVPNSSKSTASKAGNQDIRKKTKNGKKTRRIVVQADSDSEDKESDEEMSEEKEQIMMMEREASEEERAAEERAELERELMELQDKVDDEAESPLMQDMDSEMKDVENAPPENTSSTKEHSKGSPIKGKRSYWDTLNHTPPVGRRIRKEVEELVEEDGYYVTRRVLKVYDENGNEVADEGEKDTKDEEEKKKNKKTSASLRQLFTPLESKKDHRMRHVSGHGKNPKSSSSTTTAGKKTSITRKSKSINSYFQKKVWQ
ncbi:unnamed protein product [Agarophyton chilense]|eukprot:gb/GEZJ01001018.1/.p1 GENE.gb/GEZJ01001018.1/~~gb/GEZJ01001018.1/.p1  ORF type:complete len:491 (+),score=108.93 gb/GEZJ01001018.1/:462-1934(+)